MPSLSHLLENMPKEDTMIWWVLGLAVLSILSYLSDVGVIDL
ncbi:MAG: hypothetical protein H6P98_2141, partial [Candidatus Aminicenantes bacterium]|nr:hypothetical protein [Candidatus Aminicenantes bacterium]